MGRHASSRGGVPILERAEEGRLAGVRGRAAKRRNTARAYAVRALLLSYGARFRRHGGFRGKKKRKKKSYTCAGCTPPLTRTLVLASSLQPSPRFIYFCVVVFLFLYIILFKKGLPFRRLGDREEKRNSDVG